MTFVDDNTIQRIIALNREFYQTFSGSFSATRAHVQAGVRQAAKRFPHAGNILDLGCGNGNLMQILSKNEFKGMYAGMDFSEKLIEESQHTYQNLGSQRTFQAVFFVFDLALSNWREFPLKVDWDVICAFAVFHHIPGKEKRREIFNQIHSILKPGSGFVFSVWQPQNSQRLVKRFLTWEQVGLLESDVEEGDTLLDWKAEQSGTNRIGFRYVHIFQQDELTELAGQTGFSIKASFYSDGKEGNIGLYQVWEKTSGNK